MLELHFPIPLEVRDKLLDLIQSLVLTLGDSLAIAVDMGENDPDLIAAWTESLVDDLIDDIDELLAFLGDKHFGEETMHITEETAEKILRAASAIRLRIQQTLLVAISDELLEDGGVSLDTLMPAERNAYQAYNILGTLQHAILSTIDPNLGTIGLMEDPEAPTS